MNILYSCASLVPLSLFLLIVLFRYCSGKKLFLSFGFLFILFFSRPHVVKNSLYSVSVVSWAFFFTLLKWEKYPRSFYFFIFFFNRFGEVMNECPVLCCLWFFSTLLKWEIRKYLRSFTYFESFFFWSSQKYPVFFPLQFFPTLFEMVKNIPDREYFDYYFCGFGVSGHESRFFTSDFFPNSFEMGKIFLFIIYFQLFYGFGVVMNILCFFRLWVDFFFTSFEIRKISQITENMFFHGFGVVVVNALYFLNSFELEKISLIISSFWNLFTMVFENS